MNCVDCVDFTSLMYILHTFYDVFHTFFCYQFFILIQQNVDTEISNCENRSHICSKLNLKPISFQYFLNFGAQDTRIEIQFQLFLFVMHIILYDVQTQTTRLPYHNMYRVITEYMYIYMQCILHRHTHTVCYITYIIL